MLEKVETCVRVFLGLHSRAMTLWNGGVYRMVLLCHPTQAWRDNVAARAVPLWRRLLAFEEGLADGTGDTCVDDLLNNFASQSLWMHGTMYRELHCLVSEGRWPEAFTYARRVFMGIYHEKGT